MYIEKIEDPGNEATSIIIMLILDVKLRPLHLKLILCTITNVAKNLRQIYYIALTLLL